MQRTIYFLAVPQVYNAISVIYDGLAYGEREVIIQRGNTHNLAGKGGAGEIDGKCNCLERWQLSDGKPGAGAACARKAGPLARFGFVCLKRGRRAWQGRFRCFGLGPGDGPSATRGTESLTTWAG